MDGRVLPKQHDYHDVLATIPELADWPPAPTILSSGDTARCEPVSLIVPTFFNSELKGRSLRHLLAGIHRSVTIEEVVLVSSEGDRRPFDDLELLVKGRRLTVVESDPHNRGKSRNVGAAAATAPNLLFLDDDMLPRDWRGMDVILSRLLAGGFDCALFPRRHYARFPLLYDPPLLQRIIAQWRGGGSSADTPFLFDPVTQGARDLPMLFCFPGCFMLIRREAFRRLGGFSEHFVGWGFEDTDFGLRAIRELRVLNLFRQGEPLLHIDHPVSPYKSEEHHTNYQKYHTATTAVDINLFCRAVFAGDDFQAAPRFRLNRTAYLEPFEHLARRGVPIDVEQLRPWSLRLAEQRLQKYLHPLPEFIILHGSRSGGAGSPDSDYDVLLLYRGVIREFIVSPGPPPVELECVDIGFFSALAAQPWLNPLQGPMELAKIAQGRLLWGNSSQWRAWADTLIQDAVGRGRAFWLVFGLGLKLQAAKYGPMVGRHLASVRQLLRKIGPEDHGWFCEDSETIPLKVLARHAAAALDREIGDWRRRLDAGEGLFMLQVPEVWAALHFLRESGPAGNGQTHLARRSARHGIGSFVPLRNAAG